MKEQSQLARLVAEADGNDREVIATVKLPDPETFLWIVLCKLVQRDGKLKFVTWITWMWNAQSGGFFQGHYFDELGEQTAEMAESNARKDFVDRAQRSNRALPVMPACGTRT